MKTKQIIMMVGIILISTSAFAQKKKTESFKVYGNCGMCETRIEKAVGAVEGVLKADWDVKTDMLKVTYKPGVVELKKIHEAAAQVGHDTDLVRAKDEVYEKLHACCKYERPEKKNNDKKEGGRGK